MSVNSSHQFLAIKNRLSRECHGALYRQVFILAGSIAWQKMLLQDLLGGHENDSLWVGEQAPEIFLSIPVKKARSWLGNEKKIVIFDANKDFVPDSFAAISGIVVGGGVFFVLLPPIQSWKKVYSSLFGQRLIKSINAIRELVIIEEGGKIAGNFSEQVVQETVPKITEPYLTSDQQKVVERIEAQLLSRKNNPIVLVSDRGRGKSAALGLVAGKLLAADVKNIALTAPRLRATDIIFKHIAEYLPKVVLSRGRARLGDSCIQFYSPDQLMSDDINADVLLVDEAAAIPVPLLTGFLNHYAQCVFSTTVHGYEGTGRGFSLQFNKVLTEKYPRWIQLKMQTPIRWPENDPLEKWMFNLLCLDADIVEMSSPGQIEVDKLKQCTITKKQLGDDQNLLDEVFSLLVLAHYRTRPSDLKSLLDDDDLSLYVTLYKAHVIAVVLVIKEGGFSASLSTGVYRGERRPAGHLLAQSLTYHCGIEHAATLNYARIMRIAVHPELQQQGIGSALLDFVVTKEKQAGRDAVGTSFGMNLQLLNFWKKAQFNIIRIGFTREQTSGEHAAVMLLPLTEAGKAIYTEAHARFNRQCPFWFEDILKDIPLKIKTSIQETLSKSTVLDELDNNDIHSFSQYTRHYELCIAALNKLVTLKKGEMNSEKFPDNFRQVLSNKIFKKMSWKEIANEMELTGKNEARKLFHRAILYLLS